MRQKVRDRGVHVVIVNSLDRLSRDQTHQAVLLNEMLENNVVLESITEPITEPIDDSPFGSSLRQALAFAAAIEREKIIERSGRGAQNKVEKGQLIGVGKAKYGYEWGDEHHTHYIINPVEARVVRQIFAWYVNEGKSIRGVAARLNDASVPTTRNSAWGNTSVRRILKDEFSWQGRQSQSAAVL
jgi:site-specific DNA recombinase